MIFRNRQDAGRKLAALLMPYQDEQPVVLGLPRGGVVVADEVARALGAPLDVLIARKLGAPFHPELGIGAIAEGGIVVIDERARALGVSDEELAKVQAREEQELRRRVDRFRGGLPPPAVQNRTVILVDDGIATGGTTRAAARALRKLSAQHIVLATPVAAADTLLSLRREVDEIVAVEVPEELWAIGFWYRDFAQVSDDEVLAILSQARRGASPAAPTMARSPASLRSEPMSKQEARHALRPVIISTATDMLPGDLAIPDGARGIVLFAHGSGSSRLSPRNRLVARVLREAGLGTLLFDLLTDEEQEVDEQSELRFDIDLLASRLSAATDWILATPEARHLRVGYFGASTGAAAALVAAGMRPGQAFAVVSRGGRPDLARPMLRRVRTPTLFIVGSDDKAVIEMNRKALAELHCEKELVTIPGASHLFEERGALEEVAIVASNWFAGHLIETGDTASV